MYLIEFCSSNMLKGTASLYEELSHKVEFDVVDYECTNNCGLCSKNYFVLLEGQIVSAKTPEKLREKLFKKLKQLDEAID